MAKNAPVLANDLIWEYKEKGEFPKDVAERFV
jgi:hypothetical protein